MNNDDKGDFHLDNIEMKHIHFDPCSGAQICAAGAPDFGSSENPGFLVDLPKTRGVCNVGGVCKVHIP